MATYAYHGGSCCGMAHLSGFGTPNAEQLRQDVQSIINTRFTRNNQRRVIEVVLTDSQCRQGWVPLLRAEGFYPVSRFHNSNSGNVCNVFHRHPDGDTRLNLDHIPGMNDPVPEVAVLAPPPPPAEHFYIKREDRRHQWRGDAGRYNTLDAARRRIRHLQTVYPGTAYCILGWNNARVVETVRPQVGEVPAPHNDAPQFTRMMRCIHPGNENGLTTGNTYQILRVHGEFCWYIDNNGEHHSCFFNRFEELPAEPEAPVPAPAAVEGDLVGPSGFRVGQRVRVHRNSHGYANQQWRGAREVTITGWDARARVYLIAEGYGGGFPHRFEAIPEAPVEERVVTETRFANVYPRTGRSRHSWIDLETANRFNGGTRVGVDRLQRFSDGTEEWTRLDNS